MSPIRPLHLHMTTTPPFRKCAATFSYPHLYSPSQGVEFQQVNTLGIIEAIFHSSILFERHLCKIRVFFQPFLNIQVLMENRIESSTMLTTCVLTKFKPPGYRLYERACMKSGCTYSTRKHPVQVWPCKQKCV